MLVFVDKLTMDGKPKRTADGYMLAMSRVARTGIQEYYASEVGLIDGDPSRVVNVYRPEDEVFHLDALHSIAGRPVTVEHPADMVDSTNWKRLAVGMIGGDVMRDGDFIRVPMMVMDQDAIRQIDAGKVELSMGYTAELDFTPGTTPDGKHYDAVQRKIRGNHLAIVDTARGGSQLRVIDSTKPREEPAMKVLTLDGLNITVADDSTAQIIARFVQTRDAEKAKSEEELKAAKKKAEDLENEGKTKDASIATLQKQLGDATLTPAKLDQLVKDRAEVIGAAKKALPSVVVDGKTEAEIQAQVVTAKMGDAAKGWNADMIAASFRTLTAGVVTDGVRQIHLNNNQPVTDSRDAYIQSLTDGYKMGAK